MKRYKLVWTNDKKYFEVNSQILAYLLWSLTYANYLLDTKRECVLKQREKKEKRNRTGSSGYYQNINRRGFILIEKTITPKSEKTLC